MKGVLVHIESCRLSSFKSRLGDSIRLYISLKTTKWIQLHCSIALLEHETKVFTTEEGKCEWGGGVSYSTVNGFKVYWEGGGGVCGYFLINKISLRFSSSGISKAL